MAITVSNAPEEQLAAVITVGIHGIHQLQTAAYVQVLVIGNGGKDFSRITAACMQRRGEVETFDAGANAGRAISTRGNQRCIWLLR